jgi:NtrC-family two-component system sensor histidine kinase KinB
MREATLRIADGDYDARVPVTGSDELASLAEHFNAMTASLKQFHDLNIGKILAEKHKTEAILHSVDDGIVVLSPTLEITSINPMAAHIFGVSSEKMVGQPFMKMEGGEPLHEPLRLALEREGVSEAWGSDDILSVPAGEDQAHYQYSIIPVTIGSGPVIAVVILLRDVTRLKELDRLKSEFVMTASHELRTPLTSIGMSVELLLENNAENLNERGQELLRMAKEDVGRLKALVSELLDLSKIEAGRLEIEFEKVPVALLCSKTMDVMQEQARQAEISLSVDCPDELPKVRVDPNKLTWVLVNLVGNALRHTREGGTVRIHAERIGDFVHFAVADNGEGIPPEYQNKIFDKFVQVKSGRTSGGSGLGLAICKEIVRAHGGTIWVDSIAAQGSTFTFTVPVFQS